MYTVLVTAAESKGAMFARGCVVGIGGGPPPHRHMAEDELFTITADKRSRTPRDRHRR
jgi:hypothetical protein